MAWNPSPEVAVLRDTAKRLSETMGAPTDRCVMIFTTTAGQIGFVSYGRDRQRCAQARRMGDLAYGVINEQWDEIDEEEAPVRLETKDEYDLREEAFRMCLEACRVALECEKDCGHERDDLGDEYFHVKCLKQAIAAAKEAGIE